MILERPRHEELIAEVRKAGARIRLIGDGDVSGAVMTANPDSGIDVLFGTGGAPEGVIAAAALNCVGGEHSRPAAVPQRRGARARREDGRQAVHFIYATEDLAAGHVMFAATGVTDGLLARRRPLLRRLREDPVDRDALEVGHRARDRRDAPLQHQAALLVGDWARELASPRRAVRSREGHEATCVRSASLPDMTWILLAGCFAVLVGCSSDPTPQLADIGLACDSDHPCPGGTECGTADRDRPVHRDVLDVGIGGLPDRIGTAPRRSPI